MLKKCDENRTFLTLKQSLKNSILYYILLYAFSAFQFICEKSFSFSA